MINIEKSKATLENKLRELTVRAQQIDAELDEPADDDWEEQAAESSGDEVLEEVGDVTVGDIVQIKLALAQIEAGQYGICADCGDSIAEGRLEIMPQATKCIDCA